MTYGIVFLMTEACADGFGYATGEAGEKALPAIHRIQTFPDCTFAQRFHVRGWG